MHHFGKTPNLWVFIYPLLPLLLGIVLLVGQMHKQLGMHVVSGNAMYDVPLSLLLLGLWLLSSTIALSLDRCLLACKSKWQQSMSLTMFDWLRDARSYSALCCESSKPFRPSSLSRISICNHAGCENSSVNRALSLSIASSVLPCRLAGSMLQCVQLTSV